MIRRFSDTATETHGEKKSLKEIKALYDGGYNSQIQNLLSHGVEKIGGWVYDYSDVLKRYYYSQYGMCSKAYAPNKTCLRSAIHGRIYDIVEIKK